MRFIYTSILILLLITQTFSKWIVILNYQINKEYIAAKLCENKARPQLHCNGKCQFMKKMKATEEKEQAPANNSGSLKMNFSDTWSDNIATFEFASLSGDEKKPGEYLYLIKKYSTLLPGIFRPPLA
jgi:predicted ATPase